MSRNYVPTTYPLDDPLIDLIRREAEDRGWGPKALAEAAEIPKSTAHKILAEPRGTVQRATVNLVCHALGFGDHDALMGARFVVVKLDAKTLSLLSHTLNRVARKGLRRAYTVHDAAYLLRQIGATQ